MVLDDQVNRTEKSFLSERVAEFLFRCQVHQVQRSHSEAKASKTKGAAELHLGTLPLWL